MIVGQIFHCAAAPQFRPARILPIERGETAMMAADCRALRFIGAAGPKTLPMVLRCAPPPAVFDQLVNDTVFRARHPRKARRARLAREAQAEGRSFQNFILRSSNPCHPTTLARLSHPPSGMDQSSMLNSLSPMILSPKYQEGKLSSNRLLLLALLCLTGTACSTTAPTGKIIFEDARGSVSLQTISDPLIQVTHPINLEPALLTQLLTGLEIHNELLRPHHYDMGLAGNESSNPLFSEAQVQFLAPLLAQGLRTATHNQFIEYRVVTTHEGSNKLQSPTTETTIGSLYAYDRELYVILSQYRSNPMRTNLYKGDITYRSQEPLDYSGLRYRTLRFTPKAALRADSPEPRIMEKSTDRFVAVDYQLLDQAARAAEAQARTTEALAQEVDTLKQELESIKKQLGGQNPGQDSPKQKVTPLLKQ